MLRGSQFLAGRYRWGRREARVTNAPVPLGQSGILKDISKPEACPGGIALPKSCQSRNISYEYISTSKRIFTRYGVLK
jgi:hypothetical protein